MADRAAYTLLEILLVVALLMLLTVWMVPAWRGQVARQRLRSAARDIQSLWKQARVRAIEDGVAYLFEVQPNTGRYRVRPLEGRGGSGGQRPELSGLTDVAGDAGPPQQQQAWQVEGRLPDEVEVVVAEADARADPLGPGFEPEPPPGSGSFSSNESASRPLEGFDSLADPFRRSDWLPWAAFFPQGVATDATLIVQHRRIGQQRVVTLRGITGGVSVAAAAPAADTASE